MYKTINEILSELLSGEKNKKETEESLLKHFSGRVNHSDLKVGDRIIYNGNCGNLVENLHRGTNKCIISWERMGYMNTYKEQEVYNIEFFKEPEDYFN